MPAGKRTRRVIDVSEESIMRLTQEVYHGLNEQSAKATSLFQKYLKEIEQCSTKEERLTVIDTVGKLIEGQQKIQSELMNDKLKMSKMLYDMKAKNKDLDIKKDKLEKVTLHKNNITGGKAGTTQEVKDDIFKALQTMKKNTEA